MGQVKCSSDLKGAGDPCNNVLPLADMIAIVLARPGFSFTDSESMDTLADWNAAIANKDLYVIPYVRSTEDQTVDDGMWTGAYGDKINTYEGVRGKRLLVSASKDAHKIIRTYSGKKWEMFKLDRNNNIWGIRNSDDTIKGIELEFFHVYKLTEPTAEMPAMTPIEYQEADSGEWDEYGYAFNPDFRVKNIKPITYVTITVSTVSANVFTLTANFAPQLTGDSDGSAILKPWEGGVIADLLVLNADNTENTLSDVTESSTVPGEYQVTGTLLTTGSAQIKPTATNLFESNVAVLAEA